MLSANKTAHKISIQSQKTADIQQYTKMRYEMLANNKKNMIKNILDKPQKTIILNKLITLNPEPKILSEPNDILTATKHHFEQWTKKRQTLDLEDFPHWKIEYQPKAHIQDEWFHNCITPFELEEIKHVINSRVNNSAPGPTGILYIALKNLTEHNLQHILKLFNLILQTGNTSRE